jgi:hypothetical protein
LVPGSRSRNRVRVPPGCARSTDEQARGIAYACQEQAIRKAKPDHLNGFRIAPGYYFANRICWP